MNDEKQFGVRIPFHYINKFKEIAYKKRMSMRETMMLLIDNYIKSDDTDLIHQVQSLKEELENERNKNHGINFQLKKQNAMLNQMLYFLYDTSEISNDDIVVWDSHPVEIKIENHLRNGGLKR